MTWTSDQERLACTDHTCSDVLNSEQGITVSVSQMTITLQAWGHLGHQPVYLTALEIYNCRFSYLLMVFLLPFLLANLAAQSATQHSGKIMFLLLSFSRKYASLFSVSQCRLKIHIVSHNPQCPKHVLYVTELRTLKRNSKSCIPISLP